MGGPGIAVCELTEAGVTMRHTYRELNDPIYVILSNDRKTLYAVGSDEMGKGMAASYHVEGDGLTMISRKHTDGRAACHLTLSPDERFLYVANYLSGSVSVLPVEKGMLGESIQVVQHEGSGPHPTRQEMAHTHQCVFRPDTRELFVCDLGMDQIVVYEQCTVDGILVRKSTIPMPCGMGPRHLVFAARDSFYVTGELDNMVRHYVCENDCWMMVGECSTLPKDFTGDSLSAAIRLCNDKLYISNRGHDSLCIIDLDSAANMRNVSWISSGGLYPRDFVTLGQGILFAHQNGGGIIYDKGASLSMAGAVCICVDPTTE